MLPHHLLPFGALLLASLSSAAPQDPPHVVFVVGEGEYQSQDTMPALAERVEDTFGWDVTVLIDEELHAGEGNHVEDLDALEDADLVVLYLRFRQWPREDLDALQAYVDRGGPLAAFRTTTHAFLYDEGDPRESYNDFGAEILGAPWIYHYGHDSSTAVSVAPGADGSALLAGVEANFEVRSWTYHVRPDFPPEDSDVLLMGTPRVPRDRQGDIGPGAVNPVAWTRTHPGGGRVFMTTMGHPEDFRDESFRRLIGNGLHWALGLDGPGATLPDFPEVIHPDDRGGEGAPWERMDYGPFLAASVSIGDDLLPVHKSIAQRLLTREGEETDLWALYDVDCASLRCVWEGDLALRGIVYDGPHGTFPEIEGEPLLRLAAGSAWSPAGEGSDPRSEPFGPLPPELGSWRALRLEGGRVVVEHGAAPRGPSVAERMWVEESETGTVVVRELQLTVGTAQAPTLRLFDEDLSHDRLQVAVNGPAGTALEGSTVTLPDEGVVRIAFSLDGRPAVGAPLHSGEPPLTPGETGARWGEPITMRGDLDVSETSDDLLRRVTLDRGGSALLVEGAAGSLQLGGDPTGAAASAYLLEGGARIEPSDFDGGVTAGQRLGLWRVGDEATEAELNAFSGEEDLRLDGVTWRRGVRGRSLDFDGTAAAWLEGRDVDFAASDGTVAAWIQTTSDGTVFSRGPRRGEWAPDGLALFVRDGRLTVDVGWVGALAGGPVIADGAWHHVALSWRADGGEARLFVDGERVARGDLELRGEDLRGFASRFGWTNIDFPETPRFSGYMDGLMLLGAAVEDGRIAELAAVGAEPIVAATLVRPLEGGAGARIELEADGESATLRGAAGAAFEVRQRRGHRAAMEAWARNTLRGSAPTSPFRIDRLSWPEDNPFDSWMRFGAFDFLPATDGASPTSAMVTTWSGDVWRVDGLDEDLDELVWTRFATGLNQPFGIVCEAGRVLVLGRDQITELVDEDSDGEADLYRCHSAAPKNSEHFHEPASGLQRDAEGRLVWIKAARHAKLALHDHHGSVVRLNGDGSTEVLARGFRAPIGLTVLPDGAMLGSDQEGHWMPANRINLIRPDAANPPFHGNGWGSRSGSFKRRLVGGEAVQRAWPTDATFTPPLCWIHPTVDRSPSSQLVTDHPAWGPLEGQILGLSYGTGEVYLILREDLRAPDGTTVTQGGVVKLGIQLPTGLLQGRIHPATGDLYTCGLFGWSSDQTEPGGFHRVRPHAASWAHSLNVPTSMETTPEGLALTFMSPLDQATVTAVKNWSLEAWNYRRSSDYGSPTFDLEGNRDARSTLEVAAVELSEDGRTARLRIPDFQPAMQVQVAWRIEDERGRTLDHSAHLTVNTVGGAR